MYPICLLTKNEYLSVSSTTSQDLYWTHIYLENYDSLESSGWKARKCINFSFMFISCSQREFNSPYWFYHFIVQISSVWQSKKFTYLHLLIIAVDNRRVFKLRMCTWYFRRTIATLGNEGKILSYIRSIVNMSVGYTIPLWKFCRQFRILLWFFWVGMGEIICTL